MSNLYSINSVTKCGMILLALCELMARIGAMPTADDDDYYTSDNDMLNEKIQIFKKDILNRLGFNRPPNMGNITRSIDEQRRLIHQYRTYMQDRHSVQGAQNDDDLASEDKTLISNRLYTLHYTGCRPKSVSHQDWQADKGIRIHFQNTLTHPLDDHTRELKVNSAKLRIKFAKVRPENLKDKFTVDKVLRVNVYQILSISNSQDYKRTLLDSKLVTLLQSSTESFEVASAVQSWVNNNQSNLGIELAAEAQDINDLVDVELATISSDTNPLSTNKSTDTVSPTIDVYAQEREILKRVKRRSRRRNRRGDCRKNQGETKCCRYPIRIRFKDIGFDDWIIAPHEYKGYYCSGTCPYSHRSANTFASIKALLHLKNPDEVPSNCCVATKLRPFTILHYDSEGSYQFSEYPDLVVEQCKCG